jgi:hypothetical protein
VDDGIHDVETIRERVFSNVRALSDDQEDAVDGAIDRLVEKEILVYEGGTVKLQ